MSKTRIALKNSMKKSALLSISIFIACSSPLHAQQDNFQLLAAYEGNPEAQFQLALTYSKQATNYKLAAYWYKQAARQGMANAQYNLGHFIYKDWVSNKALMKPSSGGNKQHTKITLLRNIIWALPILKASV